MVSFEDRVKSSESWPLPPTEMTLPEKDVHVWRVSLNQSVKTRESLQRSLSADECERAQRFHFEIDRDRFIVARGCLRVILGWYLEICPSEIRFSYTEHGKPLLARLADKLRFNLAHSQNLALYAFTQIGEIGIDVEKMRPEFPGDDIASRFFRLPR